MNQCYKHAPAPVEPEEPDDSQEETDTPEEGQDTEES